MKKLYLFIFFIIEIKAYCLSNFGKVTDKIYRGSFPYNEVADFVFLHQQGVNTIINLEYVFPGRSHLLTKYDMTEYRYPLLALPRMSSFFDYEVLKSAFKKIVEEIKEGRTVYIHCLQGRDRTGILSSALMIREKTCGVDGYNRDTLHTEIKNTLDSHGFHTFLFPALYEDVLSWTQNTPPWVCE